MWQTPGLAPLQVAVGTAGGTETVAHALALVLAEAPETVVISVDKATAFNSIHRATELAAERQSEPVLLPMVQLTAADGDCCRWCSRARRRGRRNPGGGRHVIRGRLG